MSIRLSQFIKRAQGDVVASNYGATINGNIPKSSTTADSGIINRAFNAVTGIDVDRTSQVANSADNFQNIGNSPHTLNILAHGNGAKGEYNIGSGSGTPIAQQDRSGLLRRPTDADFWSMNNMPVGKPNLVDPKIQKQIGTVNAIACNPLGGATPDMWAKSVGPYVNTVRMVPPGKDGIPLYSISTKGIPDLDLGEGEFGAPQHTFRKTPSGSWADKGIAPGILERPHQELTPQQRMFIRRDVGPLVDRFNNKGWIAQKALNAIEVPVGRVPVPQVLKSWQGAVKANPALWNRLRPVSQ